MRVVFCGLLTATVVLVTACSPAVGSPEWCAEIQKNPPNLMNVTEEQANGMQKCIERAFGG